MPCVAVNSKSHLGCPTTLYNHITMINYAKSVALMRSLIRLTEALINKYFYVNIEGVSKTGLKGEYEATKENAAGSAGRVQALQALGSQSQ